jgi:hypothetical protein
MRKLVALISTKGKTTHKTKEILKKRKMTPEQREKFEESFVSASVKSLNRESTKKQ